MKNTAIIIPTRLEAKRFPNKPLAEINNVPMIIHVLNRAKESKDNVLLFCWDTDSYRLLIPKNVTSIVPLNRIIKNDWLYWA